MNDLDLSLDDIIKKKLKKKGPFRGRNNSGPLKKPIRKVSDLKSRVFKNQNVSSTLSSNSRLGVLKGKNLQSIIGDARLKIIQKQRHKMTDAREKLGQIAKQTDARLRLVKLRERHRGNLSGGRLSAFQVEPQILQRTIQSRINESYYDDELMECTEDESYLNRNLAEEAIISDDIYSYSYRTRQDKHVLYRTVENQMPLNRFVEQDKNVFSWIEPTHASENYANIPTSRTNFRNSQGMGRTDGTRGNGTNWDMDSTPIIITKKIKPQETIGILKRNTFGNLYVGQTVKVIKESPPPSKNKTPTRTLSERFCQEGNVSAQKISLLKAKLEASQKNNKNSPEIQPPLGHRIVVSNLVPSVTHEDVKELFEDIGELISSKVLRPGTAEVVYKLHKDAVKAVDVYHNRQLDGQPMKCLLVNNRSILPTSKLLKSDGKVGKSVVEVDLTAFRKALHKKSAS